MKQINVQTLQSQAAKIRGDIVEMSHRSRSAHLGSALSCADILTALYGKFLTTDPLQPDAKENDKFIMSKGHAVSGLYATLAAFGYFPASDLKTYAQVDSPLEEHPGVKSVPGVEVASGSLGHGLSIGLGMALSYKLNKQENRVFVLISDGECNEGSVWEAAMFAAARKTDNICVIVDFNKWQATGRSQEIMALDPLVEKFDSFGWSSFETDGNNMGDLVSVLEELPFGKGKPIAVIAHTIKGKGVSFMEDDNNWHYRIPTLDEVETAKYELGLL